MTYEDVTLIPAGTVLFIFLISSKEPRKREPSPFLSETRDERFISKWVFCQLIPEKSWRIGGVFPQGGVISK